VRRFVYDEIAGPLGAADLHVGTTPELLPRVARLRNAPGGGINADQWNRDDLRQAIVPAAGGQFNARSLARMYAALAGGGELDGVRLLSPKTIEFMTSDHLGAVPGSSYPGYGFGLGFAVRTSAGMNDLPGSVGEYLWGGAQGTYFWIDPREQLIAIFMSQRPGEVRVHYRRLVKNLVAQTLR
jgi:CubicO group peptidase (beta-lactamase class C family)